MTIKPKPPARMKSAVSDFVTLEEREFGVEVTVWTADGKPHIVAFQTLGKRDIAEAQVHYIQAALATWPGWGRVKE